MRRPVAAGRARREGGFLMLVLVIFVALGAVLALSLQGTLRSLVRDRPRERSALAVVYVAGGGVEQARAALALDPSYAGGTATVGRGTAVVQVLAVPGEPDQRLIVSIGSVPGPGLDNVAAKRRVEAKVRLGTGLPRILSWREG